MKHSIIILMLSFIVACQPTDQNHNHNNDENDQEKAHMQIIRGLYAAFDEGNVEAVLSVMDPGIHWNEAENFIYADGNPYVGPDAIVEGVFKRLGEEWEYWNLENRILQEIDDDGVLATGKYVAKHLTTGKEIDAQFAHVWKLENGKVVSFQQYADTKQVAEAIVED